MGKKNKNKKADRYGDDDIFGGPLLTSQEADPHKEEDAAAITKASAVETDVEDTAPPPRSVNSETQGNAKQNVVAVNIDLVKLEETINDIMRNHSGKSDEWLYRTTEKNMRLPKHSLKRNVEPAILERIVARIQQTLDQEDDENESKKRRWDTLVKEMTKKSELTEKDKAKLRADAQEVGLDQEEAVAMVAETIRKATAREGEHHEQAPIGTGGCDAKNASLPVSILLYLHPHTETSDSLLGKALHYVLFLLYTLGSILFGHQAKTQAKKLYDSIHLPAIKAAQEAKEKEEDEYMLQTNTHLWSNEKCCWIEKDATYSYPTSAAPPTIRCNGVKWERWSKNLKTRTKAMKVAEAQGIPMPAFTRGAFVPVHEGEGWATAPAEPEVESDRIASAGIRFLACLPSAGGEGMPSDVVDVTSWAVKSLLPKEAARKLAVIDSGRELFSFKIGKRRKAKIDRKKRENKAHNEGEEGENMADRKGVGFTANISKKYVDQMERDIE